MIRLAIWHIIRTYPIQQNIGLVGMCWKVHTGGQVHLGLEDVSDMKTTVKNEEGLADDHDTL